MTRRQSAQTASDALIARHMAFHWPANASRRASRMSAWRCAAVPLCVAGCLNAQGHQEVDSVLNAFERARQSQTRQYAAVPRNAPAASTQPAAAVQSLVADDTLAGLVAQALERNPDILAAVDLARSTASRIPQATALMDPMLMTRTLPEPQRLADGDMGFVLGVQQSLPFFGKLDRRGRAALAEVRMAIQQLGQTRLRVVGDVKRAYFELLAVDQADAITRENQALLRDLIDVARGQMVAGRRQQEDVLRAQVEHSNLERERVELARQRTATVALLNALLDRPPGTPIPPPPPYDVRRVESRLTDLLAEAERHSPQLGRLRAQIEKDAHALELARLEYWPDLTLGFEWMWMSPRAAFLPPIDPATGMRPPVDRMSEEGADTWVIMAGINLPVWWERIEAGIRAAREQLAASRRQLTAARNETAYRVQDALARVRAHRRVAELYLTAIIPQAEQAYEVSRAGYVAGTTDFQYVVDNWQRWLFFRIQIYRTIADLERAVADLEETIGVSIVEAQARPAASSPAEGTGEQEGARP